MGVNVNWTQSGAIGRYMKSLSVHNNKDFGQYLGEACITRGKDYAFWFQKRILVVVGNGPKTGQIQHVFDLVNPVIRKSGIIKLDTTSFDGTDRVDVSDSPIRHLLHDMNADENVHDEMVLKPRKHAHAPVPQHSPTIAAHVATFERLHNVSGIGRYGSITFTDIDHKRGKNGNFISFKTDDGIVNFFLNGPGGALVRGYGRSLRPR